MEKIKQFLIRFGKDEDGAAASEYAVLVAIIVVAVYAAVKLFDINGIFTTVNTKVNGCVNGSGATC